MHGAWSAVRRRREVGGPRSAVLRGRSIVDAGHGTYVKIESLRGNCVKIKQTLRGSFSAVSKPNFASKYSWESS